MKENWPFCKGTIRFLTSVDLSKCLRYIKLLIPLIHVRTYFGVTFNATTLGCLDPVMYFVYSKIQILSFSAFNRMISPAKFSWIRININVFITFSSDAKNYFEWNWPILWNLVGKGSVTHPHNYIIIVPPTQQKKKKWGTKRRFFFFFKFISFL